MKKFIFLIGLLLCPLLKVSAQVPAEVRDAITAAIRQKIPAADTSKKAADTLKSAALRDSLTLAKRMKTLEAISVKAPRPIYSMDGEVINYNVAEDETAKGLTALDALQNAPGVEVDIEGNITLRGTSDVEIWLNGYPTHMNGTSLKVFLEALPADAIDHIEVIKNPSAKYMVEEGCHIINIVTSAKLRNSHFFAAGIGGGSEPSIRPSASYVFKNDKLTANASLGYTHSKSHSTSFSSRTLRQVNRMGGYDTTATTSESLDDTRKRNYLNCFLNLNYKFDTANSINLFHFSVLTPTSTSVSQLVSRTDFLPAARQYLYQNSQQNYSSTTSSSTSIEWKHKFKGEGHNLSLNLSHFGFWNTSSTKLVRDYTVLSGTLPSEMTDFNKRTSSPGSRNSFTLSSRYNLPIGAKDELAFNLSAGLSRGQSEKNPLFFDSIRQEYSVIDTLRHLIKSSSAESGTFGVHWRHKWEYITLSLGLRGGSTQNSYTHQSLFPDDSSYAYAYLEPTLNATFRTESMHYFRLGYSLSTDFPSADNLTKSRTYSEDGYSVGNPNLKAGHTHNFNLSWNKFYQTHGSLDINTYAKVSTDDINACTNVTEEEDPFLGRIISYSIPYNVGSSYNIGIEGNATYRPTAWLNFRLYANLYRSGYTFEYPQTGTVKNDMTSYSFRLNCWVNIAKKVRVNLSGNYASPTQGLFIERQNGYSINIGASADFWQRRLSASINISDLFNWNKTQNWNTNPLYLTYSNKKTDSRFITASLTIRLGKLDLEHYARTASAN